jgi:hypothetical protein
VSLPPSLPPPSDTQSHLKQTVPSRTFPPPTRDTTLLGCPTITFQPHPTTQHKPTNQPLGKAEQRPSPPLRLGKVAVRNEHLHLHTTGIPLLRGTFKIQPWKGPGGQLKNIYNLVFSLDQWSLFIWCVCFPLEE